MNYAAGNGQCVQKKSGHVASYTVALLANVVICKGDSVFVCPFFLSSSATA